MSAMPETLSAVESYVAWLKAMPKYKDQISYAGFYPPRLKGIYGEAGAFEKILEHLAITPYQHQADALKAIAAGEHVVMATSTASGKSLIYQVPSLQALAAGESALFLFPTKALSHDQLGKLRALAEPLGVADRIFSYDGDTASAEREVLRQLKQLCLFSNPDMLHHGILPYHSAWASFLAGLRYLVIDEVHSYRGVFGTHVGNVLRRLLRIAEHYGAKPQIIAASATIGNPEAHLERLTGLKARAFTNSSAPQSSRELIFWQPPKLNSEGYRRSANSEAADLAAYALSRGLKSIVFSNSRRSAELISRYVRLEHPPQSHKIQTYRAGYTAKERRDIAQAFKADEITILSATSALELGIDIGGVDAVIMVGYPGSMMAFWQRIGRAGRGDKRALGLMIAGNDPLDSYYLEHPELIADGKAEQAIADPFNSEIHPLHLYCAAYEKRLKRDEAILGEVDPDELPQLSRTPEGWRYQGPYPHRRVNIRGLGGKRIVMRDARGKLMGESELATALRELHPGAVYLHQGENYLVRNLDLDKGEAVLLPHLGDYYTQVRHETDIEILETLPYPNSYQGLHIGRVRVRHQVNSYVLKRYVSEAVLDERLLDLPDTSYSTQALWFDVEGALQELSLLEMPGGIHGLEHTLISLMPAFILCERADIGGVSYPHYAPLNKVTIFIYDGYPGGVGYAYAAASIFPQLLQAAFERLRDCDCKEGCPRCILSPKCGNGNQMLDKSAAKRLAKGMLALLNTSSS
ncbi:MAG: DEAD/DEAH box helicase [Deinococcales bacterium]